jgi:inner membrane protein
MDSLTHIFLGAATGEAVLGKKVGNKALFWGAIAGSFPDFDVVITPFFEPVKSLFVHRGFSHSIVFTAIISILLGWIISKLHKEATFKEWVWMSLLAVLIHSGIDCFNTYGTGLLEPLSSARLAFDSLGIIDFIFLLPILSLMLIVSFSKQYSRTRRKLSYATLIFSFAYLSFSVVNKMIIEESIEQMLKEKKIEYTRLKTSPLPITNFLWLVLAEDSTGYHYGYYSNFDKKPINLKHIERQEYKLEGFVNSKRISNLIRFTNGYYIVRKDSKYSTWLYDLRFGSMAFEDENAWFVFSFKIEGDEISPIISRSKPDRSFGKKTFLDYWERVFRDV